jgi:hypothetical protein
VQPDRRRQHLVSFGDRLLVLLDEKQIVADLAEIVPPGGGDAVGGRTSSVIGWAFAKLA